MGLSTVHLFLCVLSIAGSYSFEDEFYSFLDSELTEARSEKKYSRFTREAEDEVALHRNRQGGWWRMRCCGDESTLNEEFIKEKHKTFMDCYRETHNNATKMGDVFLDRYSCDRLKDRKNHHICIAECIMKKFEIIDDEGNINVDKIKEHVDQKITKQDWMKDLIKTSAEKCAKSKESEAETKETACNPKAFYFKHCMWKETVTQCPEEHKLQSNFCKLVRSAISGNAENAE